MATVKELQDQATARYNDLVGQGYDGKTLWDTDPVLKDLHSQVSGLQSAQGLTYDSGSGTYSSGSVTTPVPRASSTLNSGLHEQIMGSLGSVMTPEQIQSWIQGSAGQAPSMIKGIEYDEGISRAGASLNPIYALTLKDVLGKLAANQISRGFYGQLPADVVTQESAARVEAEKNAEIASVANSLVAQSAQDAYQQNSLAQSSYNSQVQNLLQALGLSQDAQSDRTNSLLSLLGINNDQYNADRNFGLETDKFGFTKDSQAVADALARAQMWGKVMNEGDAGILGVPVGTSTEEALYHQQSLAAAAARNSGGDGGDDYSAEIASVMTKVAAGTMSKEAAMAYANAMYSQKLITADQYNYMASQLSSAAQAPSASQEGPGLGSQLKSILSGLDFKGALTGPVVPLPWKR